MHYGKVKDLMLTCRSAQNGKPINHKRTRRLHLSLEGNGVYELRYHKTNVVKWYPDGRIKASLNGWDTVSTRECIKESCPISVYKNKDVIFGSAGGRSWPGDEHTWFYAKGGYLCFEDGTEIPKSYFVHVPRPVPKKRSTLNDTKDGDVLRSPSGVFYICWVARDGEGVLVPYHGDHPLCRKLAVSDSEHPIIDLCNDLESLARAGEGWTPAERFIWTRENSNA